jgi:glycosyltransferase involved in cell wall biosynthesis
MKNISSILEQPKLPIAFVGTYPPRECGIATFTCDITNAIARQNSRSGSYVVALNNPGCSYPYNENVALTIDQDDHSSYIRAATFINNSPAEIVNIQHEYGIFGGLWGDNLLFMLEHLKKPVVTTFHTTLPEPDFYVKKLTQFIAHYSQKVIGLTQTSIDLLEDVYGIDGSKLNVVYHGVPDVRKVSTQRFKKLFNVDGRLVISTFGLINSSKGIEHMIDALPSIISQHPDVIYLVLGQTHPVVKQKEGESYRESLNDRVKKLGLEDYVVFVNRYLSFNDLVKYLLATDVYVTPYLNKNQIVSGTLAYAIGCGKAIVSTPYLYAEEALAEGRGIVVDFKDSRAMGQAVSRILSDKAFKAKMEAATYKYGRRMVWPVVAKEYITMFNEALRRQKVKEFKVASPKLAPTQKLVKESLPFV